MTVWGKTSTVTAGATAWVGTLLGSGLFVAVELGCGAVGVGEASGVGSRSVGADTGDVATGGGTISMGNGLTIEIWSRGCGAGAGLLVGVSAGGGVLLAGGTIDGANFGFWTTSGSGSGRILTLGLGLGRIAIGGTIATGGLGWATGAGGLVFEGLG